MQRYITRGGCLGLPCFMPQTDIVDPQKFRGTESCGSPRTSFHFAADVTTNVISGGYSVD